MEHINGIEYTDEQLLILAEVSDEFFNIKDNFTQLMPLLIEDNKGDSLRCVLDLLGVYIHIISRDEALELMKSFLYEKELSELYDYVDDKEAYKSIISRWRLSIGL